MDWTDWNLTLFVCTLSLMAVWWPLSRGVLLCWRARAATRIGARTDAETPAGGPVSSMVREVFEATTQQLGTPQPRAFMRDAARQLVVDDYETHFVQPISMYANILPPIGFIGTTCGLAILLLSMRVSEAALQMGALALALSSTIFALIGYALLEGFKISLYGRLARSIAVGLEGGDGEAS